MPFIQTHTHTFLNATWNMEKYEKWFANRNTFWRQFFRFFLLFTVCVCMYLKRKFCLSLTYTAVVIWYYNEHSCILLYISYHFQRSLHDSKKKKCERVAKGLLWKWWKLDFLSMRLWFSFIIWNYSQQFNFYHKQVTFKTISLSSSSINNHNDEMYTERWVSFC
jgi:hypothetical protein